MKRLAATILGLATLFAVPADASAQQGRHPLVGSWRVAVADGGQGTLTVAQADDRLVATLALPARRGTGSAEQQLEGVVVGNETLFTFSVRGTQERWALTVDGDRLIGSRLQVQVRTSEIASTAAITGTRASSR